MHGNAVQVRTQVQQVCATGTSGESVHSTASLVKGQQPYAPEPVRGALQLSTPAPFDVIDLRVLMTKGGAEQKKLRFATASSPVMAEARAARADEMMILNGSDVFARELRQLYLERGEDAWLRTHLSWSACFSMARNRGAGGDAVIWWNVSRGADVLPRDLVKPQTYTRNCKSANEFPEKVDETLAGYRKSGTIAPWDLLPGVTDDPGATRPGKLHETTGQA